MSRPLADWCSWLDGRRRRWTAGGQRSLAAAQTKYEAGSLEDVFALLAVVEAGAVDEHLRARMRLVYAEIAFASRRNSDATELLIGCCPRARVQAHGCELNEPASPCPLSG
jgi:hypothetical protein